MPHQISPQAQAAVDRFIRFYAELAKAKQMTRALPDGQEVLVPEDKPAPEDMPVPAIPEMPVPPAEAATQTTEEPPQPQTDTAPPAEEPPEMPQPPRQARPTTVTDIFLRLRIAICPTGTPPPSLDGYPDIGYVMAAMADEAMLHQSGWAGSHAWLHTLLEESLYGSRFSGERLFELGHRIVEGKITGRDDLAVTILLALSLDFRGRWRGINDHGEIRALRGKLYENVYSEPVPDHIEWQSTLAGSLTPVLDKGKLIRLPRIWPWIGAIAAVLLVSTCISSLIWWYDVAEVTASAHRILTMGSTISRDIAP